jgi:hypothetical protein
MRLNTELVAYGILEEKSDLRAHVGVVTRQVYVFPTPRMIELLGRDPDCYPERPVETNGIVTAKGKLVPVKDVPLLRTVNLPARIMDQAEFAETDSTSAKGTKAVRIVQWLLRNGYFPVRFRGEEVADFDMQVNGFDIIVRSKLHIQVKCDWKAGPRPKGTGNIFIQTHECNPYHCY